VPSLQVKRIDRGWPERARAIINERKGFNVGGGVQDSYAAQLRLFGNSVANPLSALITHPASTNDALYRLGRQSGPAVRFALLRAVDACLSNRL